MTFATWSLQTGLYTYISTDSDLQSYIGNPVRLYDNVPAEVIFPFVTLGEASSQPYEGVEGAREHEVTLRIFSRWGGRKEAKEISELLHTRLHNADFPLDDYRLAQCRFVVADTLLKTDRETYQSIMRFRMVTEPLSVPV
ncbi:MAG: DUF3168 domain-containing protein [Pseudomonadota bacterium]